MNICVVCYANYCRSPVAEKIIQKNLGQNYNLTSCGIKPFSMPDMDPRSREYLEKINVEPGIHNPKQISNQKLSNVDLLLAMDAKILFLIKERFLYKNKLQLINYHNKKKIIYDPYTMNKDDYFSLKIGMKRYL